MAKKSDRDDRAEVGKMCADLQHKLGSFSPFVPKKELVTSATRILDAVKKLSDEEDS